MKVVSLVFPVYNEAANLPALRARVTAAMRRTPDYEYEIVLVDDHSTDDTRNLARQWAAEDLRVRYLRLSRNFGSHAALAAGLRATTGDCAVLLAADLQDPPEFVTDLLDRWEQGFQVVWAVRAERQGASWFTWFASSLYWRVLRAGGSDSTPPEPADFLLVDRKVIEAYSQGTTRNESLIATIRWLGFRQTCIPYRKAARSHGRSGWTFAKKWKLCVDSVVGFSYWPIRAMSALGFFVAMLGFLFMVYVVWHRLSGRTAVEGWAGLMAVMLTGMGILMVMVGVLGEYLWRVLDEARGRPQYLIEETFSESDSSTGSLSRPRGAGVESGWPVALAAGSSRGAAKEDAARRETPGRKEGVLK